MNLLIGIFVLLLGAEPVVPANGLGSVMFSAGYGNRTGNLPPEGSLALRGALMADLNNSFGLGLEAGLYQIEQERLYEPYNYPLKKQCFISEL